MRRIVVLLFTLVILWAVVAQVNHALSGFRIYLFAGALFVSFAAVTQPRKSGLAVSLLGGLICDAHAPVLFGTHAVLFGLAHVTLFQLRERIPRDDNVSAILLALFANLALFLAFSFSQIHDSPAPAAVWPRLLMDLVASQVFVALVTPWFFALQAGALDLARVPRTETA